MNPITNAKNQNLMNLKELYLGHTDTLSSWHKQYKDSAWIFVGGLHFDLTEGDIICVFSQYGEIVNINLVRDKKTGASRGSAFICYEDQRSTVLAVDNLNGIKLVGRIIRVDHVEKFRVPSDGNAHVFDENGKQVPDNRKDDPIFQFVKNHGCGPDVMKQLQKVQQLTEEETERRKRIIHGKRSEKDNKKYLKNFKNHDRPKYKSNFRDSYCDQNQSKLRNPSPSPPRKVRIKQES